jgi:two-component system, cell cycle sensor histidine kinase and response regulator CckA
MPRTTLELARAEERLRAAMEGSLDSVYILDAVRDEGGTVVDFRFVDCNERGARMVSATREDLLGALLCERLPVNRTGGFLARYIRVLETREPLEETFPIHADGFVPSWIWHQVIALGDGIAITSRDVSQAHLANTQMQVAQRMESLGRMAGGVAHDFNNLLTVITAGITQLQASAYLHREDLAVTNDIAEAAERAARITRQLQAFAQRQVSAAQPLALARAIHEAEPLLTRIVPANIRLVIDVPHQLPRVLADATQVEQLLLNLVSNARDAMPTGGTLTIRGRSTVTAEAQPFAHGSVPAGTWVRLEVIDTGEGIAPSAMPHIFDPFFTTRARGNGSGLGLSVSLGIVEQHHGHIGVRSQVGAGTTVVVCWPPVEDAAPASTVSDAMRTHAGGTVLLVDDESLLLATLARALERLGIPVATASSGHEALDLLDSRPVDSWRALVTDVLMPGMSGVDLGRAAHIRIPRLPVIYISGQSEELTRALGALNVHEHFLAKPFGVHSLVKALEQLAPAFLADA